MRPGKLAGPEKLAMGMLLAACAAATSAATVKPRILNRIAVPASAAQCVAVNPNLNKVYVSGGASASQQLVEISAANYQQIVMGTGSCASVDTGTNHVWAAGVYDGSALVYDGSTRALIQAVPLGGCPVGIGYDSRNGRAWVGAQCGTGSDPTFAVDGRTYKIQTGPIRSGGVYWGNPIANPATGKAYFGATTTGPPASLSIDPNNGFVQTVEPFGNVIAVDPVHNLLFALPQGGGPQLQILSGGPGAESIVRTVDLPFTAGALAVSPALGHLYVGDSQSNSIEVLNDTTGAPLASIPLGPGSSVIRMAADAKHNRLYALVQTANGTQLVVIQDAAAK
jgi:DNA-binding beta-propeller fold protein YncE